jgi:hypothetical protein
VVQLKRKILALMTVFLATLAFTPTVRAAASLHIYGYTDAQQYTLGEKGTLKFWIYNDGTEDFILKNVTIEYPWHYYYIWEGNETIKDINIAVLVGGNWNKTVTFTVPSDGRAVGGSIRIVVYTDKMAPQTAYIPINVVNAPYYWSLKDMDKLVTLFTVQVVLLIVCTVIIAATMFLTGRKPKVTWKEEKVE